MVDSDGVRGRMTANDIWDPPAHIRGSKWTILVAGERKANNTAEYTNKSWLVLVARKGKRCLPLTTINPSYGRRRHGLVENLCILWAGGGSLSLT